MHSCMYEMQSRLDTCTDACMRYASSHVTWFICNIARHTWFICNIARVCPTLAGPRVRVTWLVCIQDMTHVCMRYASSHMIRFICNIARHTWFICNIARVYSNHEGPRVSVIWLWGSYITHAYIRYGSPHVWHDDSSATLHVFILLTTSLEWVWHHSCVLRHDSCMYEIPPPMSHDSSATLHVSPLLPKSLEWVCHDSFIWRLDSCMSEIRLLPRDTIHVDPCVCLVHSLRASSQRDMTRSYWL